MKKYHLLIIIFLLFTLNFYGQTGWNLIYKLDGYFDNDPLTFKDSLNGFAVTLPGFNDYSKIYRTNDGGMSWNEIIIPGLNFALNHILFINDNCIVILGYSGKFVKSLDGGNSWSIKNIDNSLQIISGCTTTNQKIFALSGTGDLYISTNLGESWSKNSIDTVSDYFSNITFADDNIGFVARLDSLYKTTDGGENWSSIPYIDGNPAINAIKFVNTNIGYTLSWDAYAGKGYVTKTTDGGTSWSVINTLVGDGYIDITVSKDNVIWVCYQNSILCSIDSGKTWIKQYQTKEDWISSLYSVDSLTCFALGGNGYLYKTTNGGGVFTEVDKEKNLSPGFNLLQNYPNPFNPTTVINYSVPKQSKVKLMIYDALGREIATLVNEEKRAGGYSIKFNGNGLVSGIYFYRLQAGNFVETKKMVLIK